MNPNKDFRDEAVQHLASASCQCMKDALMVQRNSHWPSCMVGRAQAFLGRAVSWEVNGQLILSKLG